MGGKGKKRREKNYKEAHGVGKNRLPPPPVKSSLDVMPSKLRKLMSFTQQHQQASGKLSMDGEENKKVGSGGQGGSGGGHLNENKLSRKEKSDSVASEPKIQGAQNEQDLTTDKKKKKRKRKQVDDLRFAAELGVVVSKRKERKKELLKERKKKHKKGGKEDHLNFPGHEEIKFGEVVQAPPKLVNVPKGILAQWYVSGSTTKRCGFKSRKRHKFASSINASQERIRLRAIEAYREQKKWASRPGLNIPTADLTPPEL
ncbi:hypothetical protein Tco_1028465 [Tanacetum coccineum]|uniref:Uncharacterized protein n=1 Tax=Tanacetum coccineum TaxID=301880 RepID=A0ABQ5G153_9ASTR